MNSNSYLKQPKPDFNSIRKLGDRLCLENRQFSNKKIKEVNILTQGKPNN